MTSPQVGASLDLRPLALFKRSHLLQATHIDGLEALSHRFSTLPAPSAAERVRIEVVVVERKDWKAAQFALERWKFQAWVIGEDDVKLPASSTATFEQAKAKSLVELCLSLPSPEELPSDKAVIKFWREARESGLLRASTATGERTADDRARLLHSPSPLVPRAMSMWQSTEEDKTVAHALDLGCGGGRDLAWICELARLNPSPIAWRCTGMDNLEPALRRAALLLSDAGYAPTSCSSSTTTNGIDSLVWAQANSIGLLQGLLPGVLASRRPAKDNLTPPQSIVAFAQEHLRVAQFDLVLLVRFLPRSLLPSLRCIVAPGGLIAVSHFATVPTGGEEYESPPLEGRLAQEELSELVQRCNEESYHQESWSVLDDRLDRAEDGRPLRSVILRRER